MVINFLQTRDPPILPSLQMLHHRPRMSNGIDVGFFDDVAQLRNFGEKNTETVSGLLYAFFVKYHLLIHKLELISDLRSSSITVEKSFQCA